MPKTVDELPDASVGYMSDDAMQELVEVGRAQHLHDSFVLVDEWFKQADCPAYGVVVEQHLHLLLVDLHFVCAQVENGQRLLPLGWGVVDYLLVNVVVEDGALERSISVQLHVSLEPISHNFGHYFGLVRPHLCVALVDYKTAPEQFMEGGIALLIDTDLSVMDEPSYDGIDFFPEFWSAAVEYQQGQCRLGADFFNIGFKYLSLGGR